MCEKDTQKELVCQECWGLIRPIERGFCQLCGNPDIGRKEICSYCRKHPLSLKRIRAFVRFKDPLPLIIHAFKYQGKKSLGKLLGERLALIVKSEPYMQNADLIVPVPLHSVRKRERGYNQSEILAKKVSEETKIKFIDLLVRRKNTKTQTTLSPEERKKNVEDAFYIKEDLINLVKGKKIIVVDDVMTSGATLEACANPLLKHGAEEVYGLIVAGAWVERG